MRGPVRRATRTPVSVPEPKVAALFQLPVALPAPTLSAVSVQLIVAGQPGRVSVPMTCVWLALVVCMLPSMQSTSPRSSAAPDADEGPCAISTFQVPETKPSCGSLPCHEPAQTPERSGGGGSGAPSPPPHDAASSAARRAIGFSVLTGPL